MVKRTVFKTRERLVSSVKQLNGKKVSVGYFSDQGNHPEAKMPYTNLMFIQEVKGVKSSGGLVHRRLFELTVQTQRADITNKLRSNVKSNFVSNPLKILDNFGEDMQRRLKGSFGDTSILAPNSSRTVQNKKGALPLIETGSLRDKLTYRIKDNA